MLNDLRIMYDRELASWEKELDLFPDDKSVWDTLPGLPNSAGTLTLHICGNLRHFIGATLGGTGYVRNRDLEFSQRDVSRAALAAELQLARADVDKVFRELDPKTLGHDYPILVGKGLQTQTGRFLIQLAVHLSYHLGQVDYARRAVTGIGTSAGTLSLEPIANT